MIIFILRFIALIYILWTGYTIYTYGKPCTVQHNSLTLKMVFSPLITLCLLVAGMFLLYPFQNYGAAETYYTTKETPLYENTTELKILGCIQKGEDVTVSSDISKEKYVEIEYAGMKGYIETQNLTQEEIQVISEKEEGKTAYTYAWNQPEFLLPESHLVSSVDSNCDYEILMYSATPDMNDDYIVVETHKNIVISEKTINSVYHNGGEYITFVVLNKDTGKWHISVSLKTYETEENNNINIGFSIKDNSIVFNHIKASEELIVGIHNNFNVKASQGGNALEPYTETYSTYFRICGPRRIDFKGIVLNDGLNTNNPVTDIMEEKNESEVLDIYEEEKNYDIYIYIFIFFCIIGIVYKVYNRKKTLRKARKSKNKGY